MLSVEQYFPINVDKLCQRLIDVTERLSALRAEYHDAMVEQKKTYYHAFSTSLESSVAARERDGEMASLAQWIALQDVRAEIFQLVDERKLLNRLLDVHHASGK